MGAFTSVISPDYTMFGMFRDYWSISLAFVVAENNAYEMFRREF